MMGRITYMRRVIKLTAPKSVGGWEAYWRGDGEHKTVEKVSQARKYVSKHEAIETLRYLRAEFPSCLTWTLMKVTFRVKRSF